jgi:ADP-heptose:LPS heptosyltransferase
VAEWAGAVVVHPGASTPDKRWPVMRFAAVARRLAAAGHRILVSGSPGEAGDAHALASAAGLPPNAVLAGRTDLGALAALVAHANLLVCGDTGVAHLATAYGTRSVLLFGPVSPQRWGPSPGSGRHTVLWRGPRGLAVIGVDEVYAAACTQLAAGARRAAGDWDSGVDLLPSGSRSGSRFGRGWRGGVRDAAATL